MNIYKYLSAAQVAELEALSKALEEVRKIKLPALDLSQYSATIDPAIYTHVF